MSLRANIYLTIALALSLGFFLKADAAEPYIIDGGEIEKVERMRPLSEVKNAVAGFAGACAGVTIGIPCSIMKDMGKQTKRMRGQLQDDFSGDEKPDLFAKAASSSLALMYGVPSGIILGTIHGTKSGIESGFHKPFSRESFSLSLE
ncbi:MAG TPA: hypothetical protein PLI59_04715 [Candidatus Obscuribacter sp.]|nr:hypothetical protein [Candidatus Obscuribacter sp.]HMY55318.1 hypothetical protein [Candidatus Obscuribacter sp.]HND04537.1 hypothetical protein [Candidatus Obscuribacter sp.]HNG18454.1 hypothetical protein [Candidatus Obscuribacter sp.]